MLQLSRILVSALSHAGPAVIAAALLLGVTGCGQTGVLYLPTEPAASRRATLPQSMWPVMPDKPAAPAPASTPAPAPSSTPPAPTPASP